MLIQKEDGPKIVALVAETTGRKLEFKEIISYYAVMATDEKGFRYAIILTNGANKDQVFIKGLVRENRKRCAFNWLTNGQASTGCRQIGLWYDGELIYNWMDHTEYPNDISSKETAA